MASLEAAAPAPAGPGPTAVKKQEEVALMKEGNAQGVPAAAEEQAVAPPLSAQAAAPDIRQAESGVPASLHGAATHQPAAVVAVQQTGVAGPVGGPSVWQHTDMEPARLAAPEAADAGLAAARPPSQPTAQTAQPDGVARAHGPGEGPPSGGFEQPTALEERHPMKPTWRRGYSGDAYHVTSYLLCTLTPSDCSTKRLRPPREHTRPCPPARLPPRLRWAAVRPVHAALDCTA